MLVIALLVIGPKRLPEVGKSLGRGMREFKESISGDRRDDDDDDRRLPAPPSRRSSPADLATASRRVVEHARAEAPKECCGMIATRDGEAVAVHRARNAAASALRYAMDPMEQYQLQTGDRRGGAGPRRDLPLAHALGPDPVADRHQPRQARRLRRARVPRHAVPDRRRQGRRGRTCACGRSSATTSSRSTSR